MKFLYLVPLIFALTLGYKLVDFSNEAKLEKSPLTEAVLAQLGDLIQKLANARSHHDLLGETTANINDYVDRLLPLVNAGIQNAGMDPTSLPDQSINIVVGSSTLTEGTLSKLATIERYENVTVSYNSQTKKLELEFILRWEDLQLVYKYHTKITLISMTGHVTADVEHMKIHLKLGFDFDAYQASVESLDFKHTGDIKLSFTGVGILDWMVNAMSAVFTTIFHDLIISIVKKVAMDPVQEIVDGVNEVIYDFLHPATASVF